jgi:hypothetical protein
MFVEVLVNPPDFLHFYLNWVGFINVANQGCIATVKANKKRAGFYLLKAPIHAQFLTICS